MHFTKIKGGAGTGKHGIQKKQNTTQKKTLKKIIKKSTKVGVRGQRALKKKKKRLPGWRSG